MISLLSGRRLLATACVFLSFFCLALALAGHACQQAPFADPAVPGSSNFYYYTFTHYEWPILALEGFFFLILGAVVLLADRSEKKDESWRPGKRLVLIAAVLVFLATSAGRFFLHQGYDVCIDEYLQEFEVGVLQHGSLVAKVPPQWREFAPAMTVVYEYNNVEKGYWCSAFLPMFTYLLLPFDDLRLGWALNPLLASFSLLLLAALAHRAFPNDASIPIVAVLILILSTQFLAMAMTKFAWTAHLFGSLLWVWLYTSPKRPLFLLTPVLGVLLMGLHQPQVHALIAFPFVARLLYSGHWRSFLWFCAWYLPGAYAWHGLLDVLRPSFVASGPVQTFAPPASLAGIISILHFGTLLAWSTPLLFPLALVSLLTFRRQPPLIQDSLLAALLTFGFYLSFPHDQGHGWGCRFFHSALGLLVLAATTGFVVLQQQGYGRAATQALIASLVFSALVQLPYRAVEIRQIVRPLSLAWNYISTRPVDYVIVDTQEIWYGNDLIRNDPWLVRRPLVFYRSRLKPRQEDFLRKSGSVEVVGRNELKSLGVMVTDPAKTLKYPY